MAAASTNEAPQELAMHVATTISTALHSLQSRSQTFEERRALHRQYQGALKGLREAVASTQASASSALMLALYEMIVNIDSGDRTWIVHLEGAVAIIREDHTRAVASTEHSLFSKALQIVDQDNDADNSPPVLTTTGPEQRSLLSALLKLRLWHLVTQLETLTSNKSPPRRIDVEALQLRMKRLRTDLQTVVASRACRLQVEHWSMQIVASELNMEFDLLLHAGEQYREGRKASELSALAEGIESIRRELVQPLLAFSSDSTNPAERGSAFITATELSAIEMLWPLTVVRMSRATDESTRLWAREALWQVGGVARLPKAFHLANVSKSEILYSDVVAGLILVPLAQELCGNTNAWMS